MSSKSNFTFQPKEDPEKTGVKEALAEMMDAVKRAVDAMCQFAQDEKYPDGSLIPGTIVKAVFDDANDEPTDFFGVVLNDWYRPEKEDSAVTRNGNRYEVLFFNGHRPFATRQCRAAELKPLTTPEEITEYAMSELKPSAITTVASILAACRSEQNCRNCGGEHRAKLGEKDEEG